MSWINSARWNRIRYSIYAPFYDAVIRLFDRPRRRSVELLDLEAGMRVLIVGCGTGRDLHFLPGDVEVVAGDITPAMVRRTERLARHLGRRCDAQVFDAAALPFPDDSFDAVILHLILAVAPDPDSTIREVARVLRPEGRVAIFDKFLQSEEEPSPVRRALNRVTRLLFTDINRRVEPLLQLAGLRADTDEASLGRGLFRIIQATRSR